MGICHCKTKQKSQKNSENDKKYSDEEFQKYCENEAQVSFSNNCTLCPEIFQNSDKFMYLKCCGKDYCFCFKNKCNQKVIKENKCPNPKCMRPNEKFSYIEEVFCEKKRDNISGKIRVFFRDMMNGSKTIPKLVSLDLTISDLMNLAAKIYGLEKNQFWISVVGKTFNMDNDKKLSDYAITNDSDITVISRNRAGYEKFFSSINIL